MRLIYGIVLGTICGLANGQEIICTGNVCQRTPVRTIVRETAQVVGTIGHATVGAVHGFAQGVRCGVAQAKAEQQAREGRCRHVGGSFGAGRYEGVGFSTRSADDAIRACCYYGRRPIVDCGVARGRNGWYACILCQ